MRFILPKYSIGDKVWFSSISNITELCDLCDGVGHFRHIKKNLEEIIIECNVCNGLGRKCSTASQEKIGIISSVSYEEDAKSQFIKYLVISADNPGGFFIFEAALFKTKKECKDYLSSFDLNIKIENETQEEDDDYNYNHNSKESFLITDYKNFENKKYIFGQTLSELTQDEINFISLNSDFSKIKIKELKKIVNSKNLSNIDYNKYAIARFIGLMKEHIDYLKATGAINEN